MTDATEPEPAADTAGEPDAEERRVSRRAKYLTLLLVVIGSGLTLLASTQTWFAVQLTAGAGHVGAITVQGSAAAPALTALALAGLALTAALAIAGPVFRIVLALLGILLGVSVLISAISALGDAVRAASAAITAATGVAGDSSVAHLVQRVDTEIWPVVAIVGGAVLVVAGLAALVTTRRWPGASKRYQATRFVDENGVSADQRLTGLASEPAAADSDEVSDDAEARAAAEAVEHGESDAAARPIERDRAIDSWDELSRGDDPTR